MKTVTITLQVESTPKELQDNLLHSIRDTLLPQGVVEGSGSYSGEATSQNSLGKDVIICTV